MDLFFYRINMMVIIRIMVVIEIIVVIMVIFFLKWKKKNYINCWIKKNYEGVLKYIWVIKNCVIN